jgi:putative transposase
LNAIKLIFENSRRWEEREDDRMANILQFTSKEFTQILLDKGIKISMDSRGRAFDNIFIERLWRSVKYEDVYLKGYETCEETIDGLSCYFPFYNNQRPHQALGYKVPHEIHYN